MTTGSEWIKTQGYAKDLSPLAAAVADLLANVFGGLRHVDAKSLRKADWSNPHFFEFIIYGSLSTWDNSQLTWLVVLAHDAMLRVSIEAVSSGTLRLLFHQRQERWEPGVNGIMSAMPTMETHLAHIRKYHPAPAEESQ